jgi:hypothetical protein
MGSLRARFEGTALYLTPDDAFHRNYRNSLWVDFAGADWAAQAMSPEHFDGKYVLIEGIFDQECTGHGALWPAGLRTVWRVLERRASDD